MFSSVRFRRHCTAFTLLELMVVLALVAVLFGLAISGLSHVRSRSSAAVCAQRLKETGTAIFNYTADHQQTLPGPFGSATTYPPAYTATSPETATILYDYIWGYMGLGPPKGSTLVRAGICPLAEPGRNNWWLQISRFFTSGHHAKGMVYAYVVYPDAGELPNGESYSYLHPFGTRAQGKEPWKLAMVPNPSRLALLVEMAGNAGNTTSYSSGELPPDPRSHCNLLFLDGHIETIPRHPAVVKR